MTLGLDILWRLSSGVLPFAGRTRSIPRLDLTCLSRRDISDLNLPQEIAARLKSRQAAEDARRRVYR